MGQTIIGWQGSTCLPPTPSQHFKYIEYIVLLFPSLKGFH